MLLFDLTIYRAVTLVFAPVLPIPIVDVGTMDRRRFPATDHTTTCTIMTLPDLTLRCLPFPVVTPLLPLRNFTCCCSVNLIVYSLLLGTFPRFTFYFTTPLRYLPPISTCYLLRSRPFPVLLLSGFSVADFDSTRCYYPQLLLFTVPYIWGVRLLFI